MDIDLLKSTPDDQIEMMLMMHMDKSNSDLVTSGGGSSYMDSSPVGSLTNSYITAQLFDNPGLMSPNQTISFSNNNGATSHQNLANNYVSNGGPNSSFPSFPSSNTSSSQKQTSMAAMREMIFRIAAMQPIYIDPETVKPPKRRNVRISKDPQSVAARHRRERISERIRILQRLVPGGTKMDTASMLDEAIHYVKFLKTQVQSLERTSINNNRPLPVVAAGMGFPVAVSGTSNYFGMASGKANYPYPQGHSPQNVHQFSDA